MDSASGRQQMEDGKNVCTDSLRYLLLFSFNYRDGKNKNIPTHLGYGVTCLINRSYNL